MQLCHVSYNHVQATLKPRFGENGTAYNHLTVSREGGGGGGEVHETRI